MKQSDKTVIQVVDRDVDAVLAGIAAVVGGQQQPDGSFFINNKNSRGTLEGFHLLPGLDLVRWLTTFKENHELIRIKNDKQTLWSLLLMKSQGMHIRAKHKTEAPGKNTLYFFNNHIDLSFLESITGKAEILVIRIHPELFEYFPSTSLYKRLQLVASNKPVFKESNIPDNQLRLFLSLCKMNKAEINHDWSTIIAILKLCEDVISQLVLPHSKSAITNKDIQLLHLGTQRMLSDLSKAASIEQICKEVGIGRERFRMLFSQVYNKTPYQYFQEHRMLYAMELILSGRLSISEVGYQIGYEHLGHFSASYKKQFGYSPSETRQQGLK